MLQNSEDACPSPRAGHSLLANNNTLYLYGGANHEQGILSDLFQGTLQNDKIQWKPIKLFSSAIPPGRYEHSAIICNNEMVIAHGAGDDGPLNDVWILDLESLSWRMLKTTGMKPPCSVLKSMTYSLPKNRIYLFGGGKYNDIPVDDLSVYCLDLANLFWVKLSKGVGLNPGPRLGHSMNMVGSTIYLYGGLNKDLCMQDLWAFDTGKKYFVI
jgi:Galactose oxidase, central domain